MASDMIRRTVAVTVRVVVEASSETQFNEALDTLRSDGPPVTFKSVGPVGIVKIARIIQSHRVEVEPETKRGKK